MDLSALPALTVAAAGAACRLGILARPGVLAAMVWGTAAALLAALALACTAEPNSTYPPPPIDNPGNSGNANGYRGRFAGAYRAAGQRTGGYAHP